MTLKLEALDGGAILKRERERLKDISPAIASLAKPLYDSIMENFYSGGRPPWAPLSPGYLKRKIADGYQPDILVRTGALMNSVKVSASGARISASSGVEYASVHQYGAGNIPPRPFLTLQPDDQARLSGLVGDYIAGV